MRLAYRTQANAQAISRIYNKPLDKPDWFKVQAESKDEESQIIIYDYIGWPYNDPAELVHVLADMGNVLVRINSPGGDVFDGIAILNAFQSHQGGTVTTRIESLAASMASVIAMAGANGKRVQAYDNAMMMIHNAWGVFVGNQYELSESVDLLTKIDTNILDAYAKKTKKGKKEISEMMRATTWMTAKEAKEQGFIDTIVDGKSVKAAFTMPIFDNMPDEIIIGEREFAEKDKERALRDVGFSRNEAKTIIARCKDGTLENQREAEILAADALKKEKEKSETLSALNNLMSKFKVK